MDYARHVSGNKYEFRERLWTIEHLLKEAIIINRYLIDISKLIKFSFDRVKVLHKLVQHCATFGKYEQAGCRQQLAWSFDYFYYFTVFS